MGSLVLRGIYAFMFLAVVALSLFHSGVLWASTRPRWIREGSYLLYDVVRSITYYNVPGNTGLFMFFRNTTYWGRIKYEVRSVNETGFEVLSIVVDTNDTKGEVFVKGRNASFSLLYNESLERGMSIYIHPSNLPENGIYRNSTMGLDKYGLPYSVNVTAFFDTKTGVMKNLTMRTQYYMRLSENITTRVRLFVSMDLVEMHVAEETASQPWYTPLLYYVAPSIAVMAVIIVVAYKKGVKLSGLVGLLRRGVESMGKHLTKPSR